MNGPVTPDPAATGARLVPILLAAADRLRTHGQPGDPITGGALADAVIGGVLTCGSDLGEVADGQADACYALLGAVLAADPLAWAGEPGNTRRHAVTVLTTAARKAAMA